MAKDKGITLIALVITIIVMLVLVAVTITMAVNGGLFDYAGQATRGTKEEKQAEKKWATLSENMTTDELIAKYTNDTSAIDLAKLKNYFEGYTSDDIGFGPFINNERLSDASNIVQISSVCIQYKNNYYLLTINHIIENQAFKIYYIKVEPITEEQAFPHLVIAYGTMLIGGPGNESDEYYYYNNKIYKITSDGAVEATEQEIDEKIKVTVYCFTQTISFVPKIVEDNGMRRLQNWYEWATDEENSQDINMTENLTFKQLIIQCYNNINDTIVYSIDSSNYYLYMNNSITKYTASGTIKAGATYMFDEVRKQSV